MTRLHIRPKMRRVIDGLMPFFSKIMGLLLLVYVAAAICTMNANNIHSAGAYISLGIVIVAAFLILIDKSSNLNRSVGLYAFTLSITRIIRSTEMLESSSTIIFFIGLFMVCISINMCVTGVFFLKGTTRGRVGMMISSLAMFALYYTVVLDYIVYDNVGIDELLNIMPDVFVLMVLYLILVAILGTEQIRNTDKIEVRAKSIESMRCTLSYNKDAYIGRSAAKILCNYNDTSKWTDMRGHGPVECEKSIRMINGPKDFTFINLQKWVGKEGVYFTLTDHKEGSILSAFRFRAIEIVPEGDVETCERISILADDGSYYQIRVGPKKKVKG